MKPKVLHVCCACHKAFPHRHRLLIHAAKHSDERNFGCVVCQKRFKTKSSLSYHAYSHFKNGDIDSMDCFPELMTTSNRKQRGESKRRSLTSANAIPTKTNQPIVGAPQMNFQGLPSGSIGCRGNWTTPIAGATRQAYEGDSLMENDNQQRERKALVNQSRAFQTPNFLLNHRRDRMDDTCSNVAANVDSACDRQYYGNTNDSLGMMYGEPLQSDGAFQKSDPQLWTPPVYQNSINGLVSRYRYSQGYNDFHSSPKAQMDIRGIYGTNETYSMWSPQPSTSSYNPDLSYSSPWQQNYGNVQNYRSQSWQAAAEKSSEDLPPLISLNYLNEPAYVPQRKRLSWDDLLTPPVVPDIANDKNDKPGASGVKGVIQGMPSTSQGQGSEYAAPSESSRVPKHQCDYETEENRTQGTCFSGEGLECDVCIFQNEE